MLLNDPTGGESRKSTRRGARDTSGRRGRARGGVSGSILEVAVIESLPTLLQNNGRLKSDTVGGQVPTRRLDISSAGRAGGLRSCFKLSHVIDYNFGHVESIRRPVSLAGHGLCTSFTSHVSPLAAHPLLLDQNPFADPAIQSSLHSTQQEASYGHYAANDDTPTASKLSLPDSIAPPPAQGQGQGDMSSRFDDLAKREQALAAREAQLNAKAEHIRKVSV